MRALVLTLIAAVLLLNAGCAKEKATSVPPGETPPGTCRGCTNDGGGTTTPVPTPPPNDGSTPINYSGGTADLRASTSMLAKMFFNSNPNNPTNIRINVDISNTSEAVIVSYTDGGKTVQAKFGTSHPYSGVQNAMYNGWVNQDGKSVWKGFFQDEHGAIILIVDRISGTGDGTANYVGGSIWFQNFNRYYPNNPTQGPLKMCWEIQMGPYDCRSFLVGDNVQMMSSYYPNNRGPDANSNYQKLGDFDLLPRSAAGF